MSKYHMVLRTPFGSISRPNRRPALRYVVLSNGDGGYAGWSSDLDLAQKNLRWARRHQPARTWAIFGLDSKQVPES